MKNILFFSEPRYVLSMFLIFSYILANFSLNVYFKGSSIGRWCLNAFRFVVRIFYLGYFEFFMQT